MTDLAHSCLLMRKHRQVSDRTLLDCLELADWLGPRLRAGLVPTITTAELKARWRCAQPTVSRRMQALQAHDLIEATLQAGPGAYWAVKRVGPVA